MLKIYDRSMSFLDAVTGYISMDRTDRFSHAGEMTLTLSADDAAAGKIVPGCFAVTEGGDLYSADSVRLDGDTLTAVFTGGAGLLRCCVVAEDQRYLPFTTRAAYAIEQTVRSYGMNAFPTTMYIEKCASTRSLKSLIGAGCLYDRVIDALSGAGLGMRLSFEEGDIIFALSEGRERDFLLWDAAGAVNIDYITDVKNYRNKAVVAGDSEENGVGRISASVTAAECEFDDSWDDSSWGERSVYVDAGDIKRADYTTVVSESQGISFFDRSMYLSALKSRGAEVLTKMRPAVEVTLRLDTECDLRPGDIVSLRRRFVPGKKRVIVTEIRRRSADGKDTVTASLRVIG